MYGRPTEGTFRNGNPQHFRHPQFNAATAFDVVQLILAGGQGLIKGHGMPGAEAVIHPIPGFDGHDRLPGGCQFRRVLRAVVVVHEPLLACTFPGSDCKNDEYIFVVIFSGSSKKRGFPTACAAVKIGISPEALFRPDRFPVA
jgi:hypothetical protein